MSLINTYFQNYTYLTTQVFYPSLLKTQVNDLEVTWLFAKSQSFCDQESHGGI